MQFTSFHQLSTHLVRVSLPAIKVQLGRALTDIGEAIIDEARAEIGTTTPQQAISPYPTWSPLAASTVATKLRRGLGRGGNPESILYATGAFYRDIDKRVNLHGLSVTVGTNKEYIVYTELGTSRMPPRPVFGPAALRAVPKRLSVVARFAALGIVGIRAVPYPQKGSVQHHNFP